MQQDRRLRFSNQSLSEAGHYRPVTAESLTFEIKTCYDTVDKGRMLLGRLYDKLRQHDDSRTLGSFKRDYQLLIELDNLKDILVSIAEKRSNYIGQLEKAQDIIWSDRKEMEEFLRMNKVTDKRLQEKVKIFSRFSDHPENLVTDLQENSQILGELLNDLKEQLVAEEQFIRSQVRDSFSASPRDRVYYIRSRRRTNGGKEDLPREVDLGGREETKYHTSDYNPRPGFESSQAVKDIENPAVETYSRSRRISFKSGDEEKKDSQLYEQDLHAGEERKGGHSRSRVVNDGGDQRCDDCDTSSLSQKLKDLVKQSENVQQLISNSNRKTEVDRRSGIEPSLKDGLSQPLLPKEYLKKSAEREVERESDVGPRPVVGEHEESITRVTAKESKPLETKKDILKSELVKEFNTVDRSDKDYADTLRHGNDTDGSYTLQYFADQVGSDNLRRHYGQGGSDALRPRSDQDDSGALHRRSNEDSSNNLRRRSDQDGSDNLRRRYGQGGSDNLQPCFDQDGSDTVRRSFDNFLQKCEEVEKKMQDCSPKGIREKLLRNLDELDRVDEGVKGVSLTPSLLTHPEYHCKARVDHEFIRQEFVKCLDKIFAMEKCFGSAGEELRNVKRELKQASQERDAVEHSLKEEIQKLKEKLHLRANDVDFYRGRVYDLKKELFDMKIKCESELVAKEEASKDFNIDDIKNLKVECEHLRMRVDAKSKEVNELRRELENAIEEIRSLKEGHRVKGENLAGEKVSMENALSIEDVVSSFRLSSQETISEELAALQRVVEIAEENQRKSLDEIASHREENVHLVEKNSELSKEIQQQMHRIEELEHTLVARNAEIDDLYRTGSRNLNEPEREHYDADLKLKEEECQQLKGKLAFYESMTAKEGRDMATRIDDFYEEFVRSLEMVNKEKEILEEDFQRQRLMYEDLLAECHNEISQLTKNGKKMEKIMSNFQPDKREILETLLSTVQNPEELAEILSRDLKDGPVENRNLANETANLQKANADLQQKMEEAEREIAAFKHESKSLKKRTKELNDKCDHLKSENYLLARIRQDDGRDKLKTYKELLGKKEAECFRLRKILDESIDYEERDELLARLREVHRELLQDGTAKEELSLEGLQESLEKRDREIRRLKRQNKLLAESLGLDERGRRSILETVLATKEDLMDYSSDNILESEEKTKMIESENRILKRQISGKSEEASKLDDEVKVLKRSLKRSDHQCRVLEDENDGLRRNLRALQNEIKELDLLGNREPRADTASDDVIKEKGFLSEQLLLQELENERLLDEINGLKADIKRYEVEASDLKEKAVASSMANEELVSLKQENIERDEVLKDLNKKLSAVEKERKSINEAYIRQKVKHEEDTKHFSDQIKKLQNDVASATPKHSKSLPVDFLNASHDSLPNPDEKDTGLTRYDRNRLIKKLQEENHQQSARILSLEEETTAITKIVADMERGHGHLTGMLRGHLVLQKDATAKLLEKALQQYSDEIESCKRKFKAIEDKYDKNRKHLTRRRFAWDLFENATATVDNITAILVEGLIKVEDDLHDEFSSDEDFEARDYKSRLWLLRRRLDEVEKRYRDLMLRAEELSVRLDAKTAEYDVTQDELEDATRVLEVNEITLARLTEELSASAKENAKLKGIMRQLKENQGRTAAAVIAAENEQLRREIDRSAEDRTEIDALQLEMKSLQDQLKLNDFEVREMRRRLHEQERREKEAIDDLKDKGREEARRYEEEASKLQNEIKSSKKKAGESAKRISELEYQLKKAEEKIANLEQHLQKVRSSCRSDGIDHHSTIHMLRDDLKKLFKENEGLQEEISSKKKQITALAKDLREAKVSVKEQLGTGRSFDEKVLDRAAKDQMMALRRRIKVLEMENAKLVRKANKLEKDQSLGEMAKKKKVLTAKNNLGEKGSASSSFSKDEDGGKIEDRSKIADDTVKSVSSGIFGNEELLDNSLASIESFKDFSSETKEEIEIRDNLIRELEGRVKELKRELAKKTADGKTAVKDKREEVSKEVDGRSISEGDVKMLKKENAKLKESLEKQKLLPVSYQVKQKDDVIKGLRAKLGELDDEIEQKDRRLKIFEKELAQMREKLGPDWKTKEIVLLDSDEYKELEKQRDIEMKHLREEIASLETTCNDQRVSIEMLENRLAVSQANEDEVQAISAISVEGALTDLPDQDFSFDDSTSKRAPKFIAINNKEQPAYESIGQKGKGVSKIPISPRPKQAKASPSKAEEKKGLERKVQEQDDDIKTLLQSVDYFEKEVQKKVEEIGSLKEKLKNSGDEIKLLKTNNAKLQSQLKETNAQDEKLQVLEENVKRLNTENKNLEQQTKKYRRAETERAKSPTDLSSRKIASLEKELSSKKKLLETIKSHIGLFKNELRMEGTELSDDEKNAKRTIAESMQKRIRRERTTIQAEAKRKADLADKENEKLRAELKKKSSILDKQVENISTLKADLLETEKERKKIRSELDKSNGRTKQLETELDKVTARNIALEAIQEAVTHSDDLQDDDKKERSATFSRQLNSAWSDLKNLVKDVLFIAEDNALPNSASAEEVAEDVKRMTSLIASYSKNIMDELDEQRKTSSELENRVEEFQKIVKETNSKISALEEEVSEKDKYDEIGHKFLIDQISALKEKVENCEKDKGDIEDEAQRREEYIERLTEQVKLLEKLVSQRETENSELTERALDSEEELEHMKARIEELEDDYNRLLQHGMKLETEDSGAAAKKEEFEESLKELNATIESLKEDKKYLETKLEELTIANEEMNKFGEDIKGNEHQLLKDTIYRLELDREDLQNKVHELLEHAAREEDDINYELKESEKKAKSLEDAVFRLELENAAQQKANDETVQNNHKAIMDLKMKISELEDENSRMEEAIYQLDVEREGLRKRIGELTTDERLGDVNDLTLLLIDNEERIADLEQEKKVLQAKLEDSQKIIDDVLQSPREEMEDDSGESQEILKGGPHTWKRRLIAAYRELREKSTELVMMKMIVESKNVEVDLLSKEASDETVSDGAVLLSEEEIRLRRNAHKQLKGIVFMLQEEVRLKTAETKELKNEISSLQNRAQLQDGAGDEITWKVNGKGEDELKTEELQKELDDLRSKLSEKDEQYEALCDQLFGGEPLVTAAETTELKREVDNLREALAGNDMERAEVEENYNLIYNELTRMKADIDSGAHESNGADLNSHREKIDMLQKSLEESEEKYRNMAKDFNELEEKYGEEMNYASTHIGDLMLQVNELEGQLQEMRENRSSGVGTNDEQDREAELLAIESKLRNSEDELKRKNKLIENMKETLSTIYEDTADKSESLLKELRRLAKENSDLEDRLNLQKQRYEVEIDSMRSAMSTLKDEQVKSLKEDFEKICNDKVQLQLKLSEMTEKVSQQQTRIDELIKLNEEMEKKSRHNEDGGDVLNLLDFTA